MNAALRAWARPLAAPVAVLAVAGLVVHADLPLPASLAGLKVFGPYAVLLLAGAVALWFNRGRPFVAVASLFAAYAAYHAGLSAGPESFALRAALTAAALFVPLNVLLAAWLPERGVAHYRNYRWLLLFAAEAWLTLWVAASGSALSGAVWQEVLGHWLLAGAATPPLGIALMAAAFGAATARALPRRAPLEIGTAGAIAAFFVACQGAASPAVFGSFSAAAGAMLLVALLQESHRMAFRDELTALPSRRALEEALHALGPHYTVAMVDVDHFKQFNDTHGHDIGDQVLRLVACRLAEVGGGGRAFRYGGEEFTLLFSDQGLKQALPHLEELRAAIERQPMAVRGRDRPRDPEAGRARRHGAAPRETLSVTVSIGVAERDAAHANPHEVIRAADQALYRAKQAGRNQVSR